MLKTSVPSNRRLAVAKVSIVGSWQNSVVITGRADARSPLVNAVVQTVLGQTL